MLPAPLTALAVIALLAAAWLLAGLAWQDLKERRLPNILVGSYAALFLPYALGIGLGWKALGLHLALAVAVGALMAVLFAFKKVGGGDVKLWAALMLWAGPGGAPAAGVIAVLAGGVLGVLGLLARAVLRRKRRARGRTLLLMLDASRGIPYGVGLALAGVYTLWTAPVWA